MSSKYFSASFDVNSSPKRNLNSSRTILARKYESHGLMHESTLRETYRPISATQPDLLVEVEIELAQRLKRFRFAIRSGAGF
jgi:hypothetical protein